MFKKLVERVVNEAIEVAEVALLPEKLIAEQIIARTQPKE